MSRKALMTLLLLFTACGKKPAPPPPPPTVVVTTPLVQDTQIYREYVGHIQAYVQIQLKSQVEGVITGAYFKEGQKVKKDDLLFTIDSRPYEASLMKAKGALAESVANLKYAVETARRYSQLALEDYVAQLQYDQYLTTVASDEAIVVQNEADIRTAQINLDYCRITSPIDGVTGKIQVQVGNLIKNAEDTPLMTLNQITPIYVYFYAPQDDLLKIQILQRISPMKIQAYFDQDPNRIFNGCLNLIDNQVDEQTGTILLRAIFPNEDELLWPGAFVRVRLIFEDEKNALLIPNEAIRQGQKGSYVFMINAQNEAQIKWVEVAQQYENFVLIKDGLTPQDKIVIEGQLNLSQGSKVTIKEIKQ